MTTINNVIEKLRTTAEPERKERSKIMLPTSMEIIGVTAPNLKKVVKQCLLEIQNWLPEELLEFARDLVRTKILECNQVAFLLLWENKDALKMVRLKDIEELGQNIDNWASVDTLSILVAGQAWREYQISDDDVLNWLKSKNRWWRRTAVVSTVPLNLRARGGKGDTKRTLLICERVVDDRDDMIVKALSWALRELSKSDKPAVEEFMAKYDSRLAGRVRREVYTKLKTGRKNG